MLPAVADSRKRKFYSAVSFGLFTMTYQVEIASYSEFAQAYLQGCEERFSSYSEAEDYIATFEEWEQPMLCIREYK